MINVIEIVIILLSILISVAFLTASERKTLAYIQRRVGPNAVGYYGLLIAIADAVKLLLKELILPTHSDKLIFFISPLISILSALLCWSIIPFSPGITIYDNNYGLIFTFAISSVGVFGILLAGWSANSKYSLFGSLRSTAQLISYELILTTIILLIILLSGSMNLSYFIELQSSIWFGIPLFPILLIFFIGCVAECARPPFDTVEAESELVSGHMTEFSSSIFVLFFLSEYASLLFFSSLISLLFLGGGQSGLIFGLKSIFFAYLFVLIRATLPRIRYDLFISLSWFILLPLLFAFSIFLPSLLFFLNSFIYSFFKFLWSIHLFLKLDLEYLLKLIFFVFFILSFLLILNNFYTF